MAQARAFSNNNPSQNYTSDAQLATLKLPPHSIEAEQSLIGGLLLDNTAWDRIGDVVAEGDFDRDDHRRNFRHISRLIEVGRPADVLTVAESIANADEVEQTGGLQCQRRHGSDHRLADDIQIRRAGIRHPRLLPHLHRERAP